MQRVIKDSDAAIEKKQARCGTYLYVFLMVVVSAGASARVHRARQSPSLPPMIRLPERRRPPELLR